MRCPRGFMTFATWAVSQIWPSSRAAGDPDGAAPVTRAARPHSPNRNRDAVGSIRMTCSFMIAGAPQAIPDGMKMINAVMPWKGRRAVTSPLCGRKVAGCVTRVTDADTAAALGSGDVPVLGTPRLIAWLEAATLRAAAAVINPGQTTVGTAVRVEHRRATAVGGSVEITATAPRDAAGRHLTFEVLAVDDSEQVVAAGQIDRVIVDQDRFLQAASQPRAAH